MFSFFICSDDLDRRNQSKILPVLIWKVKEEQYLQIYVIG